MGGMLIDECNPLLGFTDDERIENLQQDTNTVSHPVGNLVFGNEDARIGRTLMGSWAPRETRIVRCPGSCRAGCNTHYSRRFQRLYRRAHRFFDAAFHVEPVSEPHLMF